MKNLRETELKDKKVLLRVDFDVPVSDQGQIEESFRIRKQKETIDYLVSHGAKVVMIAHISDQSVGQSFAALIPQLHTLLGYEINFIKTVPEIGVYLDHYAGPALLDNIRQNAGEEKNDSEFAKQLSTGFDLYVNNAFAVCHRSHASVSAVTKFLSSYAGFLIEKEVAKLKSIIEAPKYGKVLIMGGAKASTKISVIRNFLDKTDKILIGGVIANDILKVKGQDVGESVVDENASELLEGLDLNNPQLAMPKDYNISDKKILDIGQEAIKEFTEIIKNSKMIIWNGPMGMFEEPQFAEGTNKIAQAIAESSAMKIIGGGDTISAIDKIGLMDKFDPSASSGQVFISTGGGAMLAFLAGEKLPGLMALGYYS
ncbi:MAG: phosphoglycerate kinase [Candidatus Yanofskybacteria bacterium]|nr:phosphoglycerate kinase [Candidatus Yanofskybacteria bacterium]